MSALVIYSLEDSVTGEKVICNLETGVTLFKYYPTRVARHLGRIAIIEDLRLKDGKPYRDSCVTLQPGEIAFVTLEGQRCLAHHTPERQE